jgi:hypothetical protein
MGDSQVLIDHAAKVVMSAAEFEVRGVHIVYPRPR